MAAFVPASGVATVGPGATVGALLLPNSGARVTRFFSVALPTSRGALAPLVPEGIKGLLLEPAANFCCCLAVSQDANALGLLAPVVLEGTKGLLPAPAANLGCCLAVSPCEDSAALGLLALAVPEGTKALLPAPAAIVRCSGEAEDTTALGLLDIAVPEGTKVGCGLLPVAKLRIPVVRCCARPAGLPCLGIAGGRGLLSVSNSRSVPQEVCWGLLPAANRHVMIARCSSSSKPSGESKDFRMELENIPRVINTSALVGNPMILEDIADSSQRIVSFVRDFTPFLVQFLSNQALMEFVPMATVSVGVGNEKMDLVPFIKRRAYDIATAVEMVRAEATEGYIREETLVTAIVEVRKPASRFLRSSRFGRAIELLPPPYAGIAAKVDDKVAHFKQLATEFHCIALALEAALREVHKS